MTRLGAAVKVEAFGLHWDVPDTWTLLCVWTHTAPRPLLGLVEMRFSDADKSDEHVTVVAGWGVDNAGFVHTRHTPSAPEINPEFHKIVVRDYGLTVAVAVAQEEAWTRNQALDALCTTRRTEAPTNPPHALQS